MKHLLALGLFGLSLNAGATLLINEVDSDNPSTDTAEFIELYDGGVGNTDLSAYSLVLFNGSNDLSYQTIDLTGKSTNNSGYFVVCGDASQVANCDYDISPDSNLIQNGADAVALYQAAATDFPNNSAISTTNLVDALVYDTSDADDAGLLALLNAGQPQIDENTDGNGTTNSMQRCGGAPLNTDTYLLASPTPGAANSCASEPVSALGDCGDTQQNNYQKISSIQGDITDVNNDASPLSGSQVIVEAIVTRVAQSGLLANGSPSDFYKGYWIQQADAEQDGNANTSEGIFVYDNSNTVHTGERVRLLATVSEYSQVTQLKSVAEFALCSVDNALPAAVNIQLPVASLTQWEALEGMRVSSRQNLIVSDLFGTGYGLGNYGQFVISSQLHFQGTEIAVPGSDAAIAAKNARPLDVLLVDDGVSASYPAYIPFPDASGFSALNPLRIGYTVPDIDGILHAYKNNYTIIPDSLHIVPSLPRTAAPVVSEDANLIIVGMNVLNYFNGDGSGGGFPTSRGAATPEGFAMQSDKIVAALTAMNADIVGLMEIENDGFDSASAITQLRDALNAQQSSGNEYAFVNPGVDLGSDEISVGLLYRAAKVQLSGKTVVLNSSNSALDENNQPLFIDTKNRPSLIQSFKFNGKEFTLAVNHFKSKGSACGETDEGANDVGNCNQTRTKAAQALSVFLAGHPTGSKSDKFLIIGDLNAYSQEDPMQVFYNAGYTNLKYTAFSSEEQPYSYSYSGFLGSLDHALASTALLENVRSVDAWHINSVEDSLMDYATEANGQNFSSVDNYANADAYRSSDHDPVIIGLEFKTRGNGKDDAYGHWLGSVPPGLLLSLGLLLISARRKQRA
ncbi:MAG: ExeM/NucH family extracellular endonuclease [Oceanospirillaceae bacterium]|nr:ExeM/NucH family extracellular endonuclease [Oceanospirillaceae bacterium]MCP5335618.1 ExeM/NucH family extracellular endonuclease [Oceanospirillaceae bacterium]